MKIYDLDIIGLKLIELTIYSDERGFFTERFQTKRFESHGLPGQFYQDNHSRSLPGVLRGLHYQQAPYQGKLVGVIRGRIWDVAVDLRPDSKSFGKHIGIELSDQNGSLLWIPPGFGHGFCVLGKEPADVLYKIDAPYNPKGESGIAWNDADLAISWPISQPIVSQRDQLMQSFAQYRQAPLKWL